MSLETTIYGWLMPLSIPSRALLLLAAAVLIVAFLWPRRAALAPAVRASWSLTPGVLNPQVRQSTIGRTICVAGWTRGIRPPVDYTDRLKLEQMRAYGLSGAATGYQEDHLVSLELGGDPFDPRNLWPEPRARAQQVDGIENDLNRQICNGDVTLAEAQRRISQIKHEQG